MKNKVINEEKEIKFLISKEFSEKALIKFLESLGLHPDRQDLQTDIYWDNASCDIINLKRGLRTRYVGDTLVDFEFKSLFKGDKGNYSVEEIKLLKDNLIDYSALRIILVQRLGIRDKNTFTKATRILPLNDFLYALGRFK